jgi:hypothetical protein
MNSVKILVLAMFVFVALSSFASAKESIKVRSNESYGKGGEDDNDPLGDYGCHGQ